MLCLVQSFMQLKWFEIQLRSYVCYYITHNSQNLAKQICYKSVSREVENLACRIIFEL